MINILLRRKVLLISRYISLLSHNTARETTGTIFPFQRFTTLYRNIS